MSGLATDLGPYDLYGWYVYCLYSEMDEVIYVGRTSNVFYRVGQHLATKRWEVMRVTIEKVASEQDAHDLEVRLIRERDPKYNKHGRQGFAPVRGPDSSRRRTYGGPGIGPGGKTCR